MKLLTWFCVFVLWASGLASAQQGSTPSSDENAAALEQKIRDLEDRLIALEGQVRTLKNAQTAPAASPGAPAAGEAANPALAPQEGMVAAQEPVTLGGAGGSAAKALNPDISMIGDFVGVAGGNSIRPSPSLEMHESELGVQAIIDPYARGDFFLTFGETGVGVEEGYITFTALPGSLVARVGKMRSAFGKVNGMHNHVLPFVDRPLVSQNLVGGEDGIDDAGFSVERIIPFPKGIFLSATGQLFRGDSGSGDELVFQSHSKSDVSTVEHLRAYKDLSESTNVDLGLSYARGHNELGSNFITSLYGLDATLRWKPLRRAIYHSFVARSEFIWSQRQQLPAEQRAFGMYASGEYQFHRRWFVGGRYDWSDRSRQADLTDKGGSVILTYWPSEFSQIRGQYRFTDYAGNHKTNELLLQVLFSLGAHGAHPF
ncbi:MAG: hypothetical protein WCC22_20530 [Terriglobales bacterium]